MKIVEQVRNLIINQASNNYQNLVITSPSSPTAIPRTLPFLIRNHIRSTLTIVSIGLLVYIILPTIPLPKSSKMFSKRPDKNTTGLINMRNDCFANSTIQAYSALPGLTEYLNKFIGSFNLMMAEIEELNIDMDDALPKDSLPNIGSHLKLGGQDNVDNNAKARLKITLHIALAKIIKKLQETQMTTKTISVWTFLHELERIYNARISRSQHDAHELTQLINETLEGENLNCIKALKLLKKYLQSRGELTESMSAIEFPEFPFGGLVLSQMKCLGCSHVSKPNITPFLMLTLHLPQSVSTSLETLLDENESETITGYQCLKCRIQKLLANEDHFTKLGRLNKPESEENIGILRKLNEDGNLFINEDLPTDLENFVKNYDQNGMKILDITSTVFRKTQILKPPNVFGIHLSRSAFNGVTISRNPCRVAFNDKLTLSIDPEYLSDLQKFQQEAIDNAHIATLRSKVLTTDSDDMEDESVQREDVEVTGDDAEGESEEKFSESSDWTASDNESDDTDVASLSSDDASAQSKSFDDNTKADTLQNAPITADQSASLMNHFRKFKFNENNDYKYRLKAIIRHQGSHTQGHYECYKRKPLFVKDNEGKIIKISPEIDEFNILEAEQLIEAGTCGPKSRTSSASTSCLEDSFGLNDKGNFRRKFSMIMGRRPSVIQADPMQANVQEIINSGLTTPAEVLVDDYFQTPTADQIQTKLNNIKEESSQGAKVKLRKIPSMMKHPYWRVGDSQVTEVSRSAVMFETTSVYMLYYERIDRKQVKH